MRSWFVICSALFISGCVTTPQFENVSGVTPRSIVDVIECELVSARDSINKRNKKLIASGTPKECLPNLSDWIAVADLTLQIDEQATLTPTLAHTDVVSKSLTRIFDWGVKFETQAQRVYTETVNFDISRLEKRAGACAPPRSRTSLNGDLGLEEVVDLAFGSIHPDAAGVAFPGEKKKKAIRRSPCPDLQSVRRPAPPGWAPYARDTRRPAKKADKEKAKRENAFGTSIEFVVVKGLGSTGPTWTLAHFKGPGRLFSASREDTHKVRISFAKGPNALRQGQDQNFKLLLESTSPRALLRGLQ